MPARSVHLERHATAEHPRRQDQVRIADRMIGMQMRHEDDAQLDRIERGDSPIDDRRFRTAHDACTEVDQIRRAVDDDGGRRARAVRVGRRSAGAEQHDLRLLSVGGGVQDERDEGQRGAPAPEIPCEHCGSPIPARSLELFRTGSNLNGRVIAPPNCHRTDGPRPGPTPLHRPPRAPH